jgi:peroxiredoxin
MPEQTSERFDVAVMDANGQAVRLSDFWRERPVAFVLVRYLGCLFCREQLRDLRRHAAAIEQAGVQLVVITPDRPDVVRKFNAGFRPSFPILSDPRRAAYQAFGLTEGTFDQLLSPALVLRGARALLRGSLPGRPTGGNRRQLPGVAIVDTGGTVLFHQAACDAGDHISGALLLRQVRRSGSGSTHAGAAAARL